MNTAQKNQLLAALAISGKLWPSISVLFLAMGCPSGYCAAQINIRASSSIAPFDYPLCGDDTDS